MRDLCPKDSCHGGYGLNLHINSSALIVFSEILIAVVYSIFCFIILVEQPIREGHDHFMHHIL